MTRRRLSGADRRAQLLDVARDIVAADGYPALTIERVAAESEVTRAVVYQQFIDLDGLTTALLDRESAIAFAGMGTVADLDDADEMARGILAYLQAAPTSWRITLRPPDGAPAGVRQRMELGRSYARRVAARHLGADPDDTAVRVLLAAIEELARLHLEDPAAHPGQTVLEHLRSLTAWAGATAGSGSGRGTDGYGPASGRR
ncbi:TetR/AcrR family transcriptional regulator [Mycobacterium sp. NPDC003323]